MVKIEEVDDDAAAAAAAAALDFITDEEEDMVTAISLAQYEEEQRELNLAIMASLLSFQEPIDQEEQTFAIVPDEDRVPNDSANPQAIAPSTSKEKRPFDDSVTEKGQSSSSATNPPGFVCEICVELNTPKDLFSIMGCSHGYCKDCVVKYVASKLQENISHIACPVSGCQGLLEPYYCRSILPDWVFDRWADALCEAQILGFQKFYCPYKDCSAMLIDDGKELIRESECPNCRRMFCAQCKVPWHAGIGCDEYQKLNKDEREKEDIMLMNLAGSKLWKRCPSCRIYVERTQGCKYVKCRCGTAFCYGCGTTKVDNNTHGCYKCG